MLSPASTLEVLSGKSLLSFVLTMIIVAIGTYLTGYKPENLLLSSLAIILSAFFYIGLGTVVGLFTKSIMEASTIAMPFMFLFSFGSMVLVFEEKYPILKVLHYTPNEQLTKIARILEESGGLADIWLPMTILLGWAIGIFVLASAIFRKRKID